MKNICRPSKELAEFIGIMLGDGSIGIYKSISNGQIRKQYRLKVTTHSEDDKEYSLFVSDLIEKIFLKKPLIRKKKNENTVEVLLFSKKIVNLSLENQLLTHAPKWNRASIPDTILQSDFDKDVLRGILDTDGSVVRTMNNGQIYPRLELKISPSPMQKQIIQILQKYNLNFRVHSIGKGKVRLQANGLIQLKKWSKLVGFNNPKHLKKVNTFLNR